MKKSNHSRRRFLKKVLTGSTGIAALSSAQLGLFNSAFAQSSCSASQQNDYKALVCVFLFGGNDSYNMLIPMRGDALSDYQAVRQGLARSDALEIFPSHSIDGGIGLVPEMQALKTLFDSGKLAIQANVGPLIEPVFSNGQLIANAAYPRTLLAHDAQQETWQRGADLNQANTGATGWSGRVLDALFCSQNTNDTLRNVSLWGQNTWQTGFAHHPYNMFSSGVETLDLFYKWQLDDVRAPLLESYLQNSQYTHKLTSTYATSLRNAEFNARTLETMLAETNELTTSFPPSNLGEQLKMITKLMRIGKASGLTRQVFFVGMGGFDTHSNQASTHPALLGGLSEAMASFYHATQELEISEQVTSFTMSDFGRTLTSNGDGTDHGWAGHQFILGGAVQGDIYGDLPPQSFTTLENFGGKMVPTTASEEMYASMAQWFGINRSVCDQLFPNLKNFVAVEQPLNIDYFRAG